MRFKSFLRAYILLSLLSFQTKIYKKKSSALKASSFARASTSRFKKILYYHTNTNTKNEARTKRKTTQNSQLQRTVLRRFDVRITMSYEHIYTFESSYLVYFSIFCQFLAGFPFPCLRDQAGIYHTTYFYAFLLPFRFIFPYQKYRLYKQGQDTIQLQM